MIVASAARDIERIGVGTEQAFQIKATSKAFHILSSALYKDKILAIVRELSCNAYDAHVVARKPLTPIRVHLPNTLEPFFSVADEGPGLSDTDMRTIYTSYFESTKTLSNDLIGTLGLGSKSPFSYVDSFTVISRHAGEQRTYTAFKAEDGSPTLVEMGSMTPTDESGLEVIIPVSQRSDFHEFAHRAQQVFQTFHPVPVVTGAQNFVVERPTVTLAGKGYRLVERPGAARAIMGLIAYPIWSSSVNGDPEASNLLDLPLDIDFPNGSMEFTAGREELSYDAKVTIPAILARVTEVAQDLPLRVEEMFAKCQTEFEARCLFATLFHSNSPLNRYLGIAKKPVMWRGKALTQALFEVSFRADKLSPFKTLRLTILTPRGGSAFSRTSRVSKTTQSMGHGTTSAFISARPDMRVVIDDLPRGTQQRARYLTRKVGHEVIVVECADPAELDLFKAHLDGVPFIKASDLDKPPAEQRQKASIKVFAYSQSSYVPGRKTLRNIDVDLDEGGYYVLMRGDKVEGCASNDEFAEMYRLAQTHKMLPGTVHFVPSSLAKRVRKHEDWIEFIPAMRQLAEVKVRESGKVEDIARVRQLRDLEAVVDRNTNARWASFAAHLGEDHPLGVLTQDVRRLEKQSQEVEAIARLATRFGIDLGPDDAQQEASLVERYLEMIRKYPLAAMLTRKCGWFDTDFYRQVAAYIRLVDAQASA